ncbi:MAG: hypothetical protein ACJAUV_002335 [Flavobacteriales bacterium]|jgi:hypothetical protein
MNDNEGLLKLLNYGEHPTNSLYLIFHFVNELHASTFKGLLEARNVWFEHDVDDEGKVTRYFFAIKKADRKAAVMCNYLVKGTFRKKIISVAWLRWTLLIGTFLILTLAFMGYLRN